MSDAPALQGSEEYAAEEAAPAFEHFQPLQPSLKLNCYDNIDLGLGALRGPGAPRTAENRLRSLSSNVAEFSASPEQFRAPRAPALHSHFKPQTHPARRQRPFADLDLFSVTAKSQKFAASKLPPTQFSTAATPSYLPVRDPVGLRDTSAFQISAAWRDAIVNGPVSATMLTAKSADIESRPLNKPPNEEVPSVRSSRQKHQCDICMNWYANLDTHKLSHAAARPHRCAQCSREFSRMNDLLRHKRTHEICVFRCPYWFHQTCHRTGNFSRGDTYKRHLLARHFAVPEGTVPVKRQHTAGVCKACGHPFSSAIAWLSEHIENASCPKIPNDS